MGTVRRRTAGYASSWAIFTGQIGCISSDIAGAYATASCRIGIEVVKSIVACAVARRAVGRRVRTSETLDVTVDASQIGLVRVTRTSVETRLPIQKRKI